MFIVLLRTRNREHDSRLSLVLWDYTLSYCYLACHTLKYALAENFLFHFSSLSLPSASISFSLSPLSPRFSYMRVRRDNTGEGRREEEDNYGGPTRRRNMTSKPRHHTDPIHSLYPWLIKILLECIYRIGSHHMTATISSHKVASLRNRQKKKFASTWPKELRPLPSHWLHLNMCDWLAWEMGGVVLYIKVRLVTSVGVGHR